MKKNFSKIIVFVALIPIFSMCNKEIGIDRNTGKVVIEASVNDASEKVSLTPGEGLLALAWQSGDALVVSGTSSGTFTIMEGFTAHSASFEGPAVEGSSFDIHYPSTYATKADLLGRTYTGQAQDGNASTAHLEYNALIEGAADYHTVVFNKTTARLNGVLKLVLKMPDEVTGISSLCLNAPSKLFFGDNTDQNPTDSLFLSFTNTVVDSQHKLTAYIMTSMQDATIPSGTKLTITVKDTFGSSYKKTFHNSSDIDVNGGQTLKIDISDATTMTRVLAGAGTEASPYEIYSKEDMQLVRTYLAKKDSDTDATYFKLMNDVDMNGAEFAPLANGSKFYKIDFTSDTAGGRKTLSRVTVPSAKYASLFGALNGSVHDVNFDNIHVTVSGYELGAVICAYLGGVGSSVVGTVKNVSITNSDVYLTNSVGSGTGIVCGNFARGTIENVNVASSCTSAQKITSQIAKKCALGGIAGYTSQNGSYLIKSCSCAAAVTCQTTTAAPSTKENFSCGGIIGMIANPGVSVQSCVFQGQISASESVNFYYFGGIVGLATPSSLAINGCYNFCDISLNHHYVGGIIGRSTGASATISGCINYGDITSAKTEDRNYIAGIAGQVAGGTTVTGCRNVGYITANGASAQYVAGILGQAPEIVHIKKCANLGNVTSKYKYIGGIIGFAPTASDISECLNTGAITGNELVGGIVGTLDASVAGSEGKIENCYSKGNVTVSAQVGGGIVGELLAYNKVTACYASGNFTGGRSLGGIIGRANAGGWSNALGNNPGNVVKYVIVWPGTFSATGTAAMASSGAVTGFNATKNSYTYCYRRDDADVSYSFSNCPSDVTAPVNQYQTTSNVTIGITKNTTTNPYWYPYHANTVSNSSYPDISKIAVYVNTKVANAWNTSIWDLTTGFPTLVNTPEQIL